MLQLPDYGRVEQNKIREVTRMRESYELYVPPHPKNKRSDGLFTKGMTSPNKGKTWNGWIPLDKQKKLRALLKERGLAMRGKPKPWVKGGIEKKCIAIFDDGKWTAFDSLKSLAKALGVKPCQVSITCIANKTGKFRKSQKKLNFDHKCKGVRCYYEDDIHWVTRIGRQ